MKGSREDTFRIKNYPAREHVYTTTRIQRDNIPRQVNKHGRES